MVSVVFHMWVVGSGMMIGLVILDIQLVSFTCDGCIYYSDRTCSKGYVVNVVFYTVVWGDLLYSDTS